MKNPGLPGFFFAPVDGKIEAAGLGLATGGLIT
jgi:hypothetical protein